jgi:glycyl-radical enzyme activating protein
MKGRIFDIKRFSIHDGPGIRTTAFFKGCPLHCIWCHNPEGIGCDQDLIVGRERCIQCGVCVKACPEGAIRLLGGVVRIDRSLCSFCGRCVDQCPPRAIRRVERDLTDDELVEELMQDKVFADISGGVTLSGGEPLFQPEFALSVLQKLKSRGMDTCIETSMMAPLDVVQALPELLDHCIVDIKLLNDEVHKRYTGVGNVQILENFRYLSGHARDLLVRIPLIPGVTATDENLKDIAAFVRSLNPAIPIELLNFNSLAASKYDLIDQRYYDETLRALPKLEYERLKQLVNSR